MHIHFAENIDDSDGIMQGNYQLLYASPESVLRVDKWRNMLGSSVYQENLMGVAIDEAHCICTW